MNIRVNLEENSYDINITEKINFLNDIVMFDKYNKVAIITDENVFELYESKMIIEKAHRIIKIKAGETSKKLDTIGDIIDQLSEFNLGRKDLIVAFGGGVVGDIAGFVGSIYQRGVDFIQVPTSLLAMVDSSVGGKNGVDTSFGKNLIGTFYQPKAVLIYTEFLQTLDDKELNTGFAEIIKHGLIKDSEMFEYLLSTDRDEILSNMVEIVHNNCKIKASVVEEDEKESGTRMILNFGHTIGHAIEKQTNFEKFTHGEAVAIGMAELTKVAVSKGLVHGSIYEKIKTILIKFDLPFEYKITDEIIENIKSDKKMSNSQVNFIIVKEVGQAFIHKADLSFLR